LSWADDLIFWGWQSNSEAQVYFYSSNGSYERRLEPAGSEDFFHFNVNAARNEVAITFYPVAVGSHWYNTPAKLLIYNYDSPDSFPREYDQTFFKPGKLTFNQDGSKIYGIAEGTVIGNLVIENNDENHIIYKFSNE